jgi:NADH:ubiquinone oxidoreductase subunit F (NADH-binding)
VLPDPPIIDFADYIRRGGGAGLEAARKVEPADLIGEVEASGLRGRGGAGFPTGVKWRTVAAQRRPDVAATVVVNGAEGEPGTFKDRTIVRSNPYAVIEGALIAARAVGATAISVALKQSFSAEADRLRDALGEVQQAGWLEGVTFDVFLGPAEYLFGEETALLESIDGRPPFPRVAPPYMEGARTTGSAATAEMAGDTSQSPALVNNVETMANVPAIILNGAEWFREVGTADAPGTFACTVSGATQVAGVGEFPMGTTAREAIEAVGGGAREGHQIVAALMGVSGPALLGDDLDEPLPLGAIGLIALDEDDDLASVIAGASRFLAIESCGQCVPCKRDGLDLAERLARLAANEADAFDVEMINKLALTVSDEARCALARQHEALVTGFLEHCPSAVDVHVRHRVDAVAPALVAPIVDISEGVALVDSTHADKQPDWTYDETDSGKWPAERL